MVCLRLIMFHGEQGWLFCGSTCLRLDQWMIRDGQSRWVMVDCRRWWLTMVGRLTIDWSWSMVDRYLIMVLVSIFFNNCFRIHVHAWCLLDVQSWLARVVNSGSSWSIMMINDRCEYAWFMMAMRCSIVVNDGCMVRHLSFTNKSWTVDGP